MPETSPLALPDLVHLASVAGRLLAALTQLWLAAIAAVATWAVLALAVRLENRRRV